MNRVKQPLLFDSLPRFKPARPQHEVPEDASPWMPVNAGDEGVIMEARCYHCRRFGNDDDPRCKHFWTLFGEGEDPGVWFVKDDQMYCRDYREEKR